MPTSAGYADVAADLRRRIAAGEFAAGSRLPSETEIGRVYGVSRGRARSALAQLARQSVVVSRPRDGWYVRARHETQAFDRMLSFAQWAASGGRSAGGTIVERSNGPADAREATLLRTRLGEPLQRFTRVRTLDGRVVMVERSAWAPWVASVVDAMPDDIVSTTVALAHAGILVASGSHRITAVAASREDAELLGVRRSSPLLQVSRVTTTADGRVVELGTDRYRSDAIAFEVVAGESTRTTV
jgi:GntR family transcriptional regulator